MKRRNRPEADPSDLPCEVSLENGLDFKYLAHRAAPALADDEERPDEAASTSGATNDALPSAVASSVPGRMSRSARPDTPKDAKAAQKMMYSLLEAVTSHRNGSVFQNPVKKVSCPALLSVDHS